MSNKLASRGKLSFVVGLWAALCATGCSSLVGHPSPMASLASTTSDGGIATPNSMTFSDGLTLTVPPTWQVSDVDISLHYEHVLAYLGNGTGSYTCDADYIPGAGGTCKEEITLPANGIEAKLSFWAALANPLHSVQQVLAEDPTATSQQVNGSTAAVRNLKSGPYASDSVIEWTIDRGTADQGSFVFTAYVRGPDQTMAISQLSDLISSIIVQVPPAN